MFLQANCGLDTWANLCQHEDLNATILELQDWSRSISVLQSQGSSGTLFLPIQSGNSSGFSSRGEVYASQQIRVFVKARFQGFFILWIRTVTVDQYCKPTVENHSCIRGWLHIHLSLADHCGCAGYNSMSEAERMQLISFNALTQPKTILQLLTDQSQVTQLGAAIGNTSFGLIATSNVRLWPSQIIL